MVSTCKVLTAGPKAVLTAMCNACAARRLPAAFVAFVILPPVGEKALCV